MTLATEMLELSLQEIKKNYSSYGFMVHRDVAWTLQKLFNHLIEQKNYPLEVYQNYPLKRGYDTTRDHELVIVNQGTNYHDILRGTQQVELIVRILLEPSRHRRDICDHHLPRVRAPKFIDEMKELQSLIDSHLAKQVVLLLVDEYSRHQCEFNDLEHLSYESWGTYEDSGLNVSLFIYQNPFPITLTTTEGE